MSHCLPFDFAILNLGREVFQRFSFFKQGCQHICFVCFEPVDIFGACNCAARNQSSAKFTKHAADLWMSQPHIGDAVLAQWSGLLCPCEHFDEPLAAQWIEPFDDCLCCLFAAFQSSSLTFIWVVLPAQINLDGFHQRRGIVGWYRFCKIQIVDGMTEFTQVNVEAGSKFS